MSKIVKVGLGIVVGVALVAGGVKAVKNAREKDKTTPKAKIYPVVVSKITPKLSQVQLTLPYLAEVANDKDVTLSSRIAARIIKILPSGSKVKKGDLVVKLDTTSIKSALSSLKQQLHAAKITLQNLQQTHERTLELLKVKGASIEEAQKEENMIASAQASLNALKQKEIELKNNLSYATITSPVDGVIAKTFSNKGAVSMPGKPLVAISSKNGFYLMVRVPSNLPIQGVKFKDKIYPATALGSTFNGLAEYKVYTGNTKLTSGDRVEVDVVVFDSKAILLPFDALLNRNGKSYVLVISKDKANLQEVHIIQSAQQGVVVADDLEGKDIVLAKPDILVKLTSGYRLKVKE
jgi:multidrug efflux pump subunit AcrA (membrane-fusion protein)